MKPTIRTVLILGCLLAGPTLIHADIVYPSRLQIIEVEPNRFRVTFTLPFVNGMKPRAEVVLPEFFRELAAPQISATSASYFETWEVRGAADSLYGQRVGVQGLIGTPIDVLLQIDLLNGRSYAEILKPGNAYFIVSKPPSKGSVFGQALLDGTRSVLSRPELWLLFLVLVFAGMNRRTLLALVLVFVLARSAGQWLTAQQWMQLSPIWPALGTALLATGVAQARYRERIPRAARLRSLWVWMLPIGALYGTVGLLTAEPSGSGLSDAEQYLKAIGLNLGAGLGLLGLGLLWRELRQGMVLSPRLSLSEKVQKRLWYAGGLLTTSLFFYLSSSLVFYPSLLPEAPPIFFVTPLLLGGWLAAREQKVAVWEVAVLLLLLVVGLILGFRGYHLPLGMAGPFVLLFFISSFLVLPGAVDRPWQWGVAGSAVLYVAAQSGTYFQENLPFALAQAVGFSVLAFLLGLASFSWMRFQRGALPGVNRWLGIAGILFALLWRGFDYVDWWNQTVLTRLALGQLVLPLLSLLLLTLAIILWPRRRRVPELLGLETARSYYHLFFLVLSFFLLPVGVASISNPFFEASAPGEGQAERILEQVLGNTYHAFNLEQEEQLYDRLAESVSENLIADIYLDSRRRLTTGVREGAEVTVRTVEVQSVGEAIMGTSPADGFTYPCRWSVTARVRHLQHIHHRKNIYSGELRIKIIDNQWKIDQVSLKSEDRVIIPGAKES